MIACGCRNRPLRPWPNRLLQPFRAREHQETVLMRQETVLLHPAIVRLTHWTWALGILLLIGSGWRIYNSEPVFDFYFPTWMTLGGSDEATNRLHNDFG